MSVTNKIILSVESTLSKSINGLRFLGLDEVSVPDSVKWDKVVTRPHPSLTIEEKTEDKVVIRTATLKFYTCQDIIGRKILSFRVKTLGGGYLLIGTNRRPYPVVKVTMSYPDKPSDNQWNEVTVTWTKSGYIPRIK